MGTRTSGQIGDTATTETVATCPKCGMEIEAFSVEMLG